MAPQNLQDLVRVEDGLSLLADRDEVLLLKDKVREFPVDLLQGGRVGCEARIRDRVVHVLEKLLPGHRARVLLTEVREHVVDVLAEHRIQGHQVHVLRAERLSLVVEQVGDALQKDRGLSGARDAVDEHHRHVRIADDGVLLLLDGRGDGLHLVGAGPRERGKKKGILDGDLRVKVPVQVIPVEVKLAPQEQVAGNLLSVHRVVGLSVVLVVVGLCKRASPVEHHLIVAVLREGGAADVVVLRLLVLVELNRDPCKIGGLEEGLYGL